MKLRKGLETSGMDVVAVPRHLQSRTATPSLTKPRRSTIIFQRNLVVPTRIHYPCPHTFSSTPLLMDSHAAATTTTSKPLQAYRSSLTNSSSIESPSARIGEVKRVTNETNVSVKFNLDGTGIADSTTGIPFLDHILDQLSSHGLFDVHVRATGDIHIDDHHTNEGFPLGDRKGINRFGDFSAPLDEALIHVSLDLSGGHIWVMICKFLLRELEHMILSLLEEILIILLRQPSKLLPGLFDKQQNMTHVASGLCQAQRGGSLSIRKPIFMAYCRVI
ncbi:uncharacterized protein [Populus alba]|uniref:uncharacterized protein isoform X2 n=1 Tax=Populus alba TaxID=43335 RepID=UPI00158BF3D0|nr:imidazoleglycerol-phosphate dehydratase, chloroplastic-like isoform X2 [Populus alba]